MAKSVSKKNHTMGAIIWSYKVERLIPDGTERMEERAITHGMDVTGEAKVTWSI